MNKRELYLSNIQLFHIKGEGSLLKYFYINTNDFALRKHIKNFFRLWRNPSIISNLQNPISKGR